MKELPITRSMSRMLRGVRATCPFVGVGVGCLSLAILGGFVTDDAAITLRYSDNLAEGHGLRWNPGGDPVEGFTSITQVVLGAVAYALGLAPLTTLRLLNQACLLVLCLLVYVLAHRRLENVMWGAAAATLVGAHAPFAYWVSSGLETGLFCVLVYSSIWAWGHDSKGVRRWLLLPLLLLTALTRFDGIALFVVLSGTVLAQSILSRNIRPLRSNLGWMAGFVIIYGGYFVWRLLYFGHLLPNSAYYKSGAGNGFELVATFFAETPALWLLVPLAAYRRLGWLSFVLLCLIAAYVTGFYDKKASVAYFHRFLLPVVPALAILTASALDRVWRARDGAHGPRAAAFLLLASILWWVSASPKVGFAHVHSTVNRLNSRIVSRARTAVHIIEHYGAERVVAIGDVGVVGYVIPNRVIDTFGLNDERFPHTYQKNRRRYLQAVKQQKPDIVVVVSKDASHLDPHYATGRDLTDGRLFHSHYGHRATIASPLEPYHYMIFARNSVPEDERDEGLGLREDLPLPLAVDYAAFGARDHGRED